MKADNPFLTELGVRVTRWEPEFAELECDLTPRHMNRQGGAHGGIVATLLDTAGGYSGLRTSVAGPPGNCVTIMLTVSYLAAARQGTLTATGRLTRAGRSLFFATAQLVGADGSLLATAQGSFKRVTVADNPPQPQSA